MNSVITVWLSTFSPHLHLRFEAFPPLIPSFRVCRSFDWLFYYFRYLIHVFSFLHVLQHHVLTSLFLTAPPLWCYFASRFNFSILSIFHKLPHPAICKSLTYLHRIKIYFLWLILLVYEFDSTASDGANKKPCQQNSTHCTLRFNLKRQERKFCKEITRHLWKKQGKFAELKKDPLKAL